MQLNTLNRVIALFLIGGLVIVVAGVALEKQITPILEQYSRALGASAGFFLAVALLSTTALAGIVIDALGNITVCVLVRQFSRKRFLASLFFCAYALDAQNSWRKTFGDALERSARYKELRQRDDMIKSLSAGLFFRAAAKEHSEWLVQHYSMYHLSANFVIVLIACVVWLFRIGLYYAAFGGIVAAYLLTSFALYNYLYTYQLSFRNAYLALAALPDVEPSAEGLPTRHGLS